MALSRGLFLTRKFLSASCGNLGFTRTYKFLPVSYHLEEEWNARLNAPLMQQIRIEEFYVELRKKFDADKSGSSLDVEIFVNRVEKISHLHQMQEILASFRKSKNTAIFRPGINHAAARIYLTVDAEGDLLPVLADKVKYGLFLDPYNGSLLMDKFLSLKNTSGALKCAFDFMFQEDFKNAITRDLAIMSCLAFLENAMWDTITPPPEPVPVETGEEIIQYIDFIRNPWFDNHFDLKDPKHLLGKTLYLAGKERDDLLGRSAQLSGISLYQKWDKGLKLLEKFVKADGDRSVLNSSVNEFMEALRRAANHTDANSPKSPEDVPPYPKSSLDEPENMDLNICIEQAEKIVQSLKIKGLLKDGAILLLAEEQLKKTVSENASLEAAKQKDIYQRWITDREEEVNLQIKKYDLEERLKDLRQKRDKLKSEEDFLFFFERKNEWEKLLTPKARQAMLEQQDKEGSFYDYRVQDAGYEIQQIKEAETYKKLPPWLKDQTKFDENQEFLRNK